MSKSEDYLDQLLRGVNPSEAEDSEAETDVDADAEALEDMLLDDDFFGEELDEAFGDDDLSEEFLREFEMEMAGLDEDFLEDDLTDDENSEDFSLEDLMSDSEVATEEAVSDEATVEDTSAMPSEEDDLLAALLGAEDSVQDEVPEDVETVSDDDAIQEMFDTLGSIVNGEEEPSDSEEGALGDLDFAVEEFSYDDIGSAIPEEAQEAAPSAEEDAEAQVAKLLEGFSGMDSELDDLISAAGEQTEESKANDDALLDFLSQSDMGGDIPLFDDATDTAETVTETKEEVSGDKKKAKKNKKKDKQDSEQKGFLGKLGTILFGEDDEDEEKPADKPKEKQPDPSTEVTEIKVEEFSAGGEYDDLFKDFTTSSNSAPVEEKKEEVEDKKKGKKKKEKAKKEKVKKEKKPKPKKEKKPKKPKEPDNTPPLPKKPVFLIFLMVASFVALMLMGTNLLGYSNSLNHAKNAYAKKNYTEAYSYVSAVEIKEKDMPLYEKYQTMALVEVEIEAYKTLMGGEFYDMALDSLIRGIGRAEKYKEDAKTYGCTKELNALELEAETILKETFNLTREEALELYNYRDRRDYSNAINKLLKELGMEKVTEE